MALNLSCLSSEPAHVITAAYRLPEPAQPGSRLGQRVSHKQCLWPEKQERWRDHENNNEHSMSTPYVLSAHCWFMLLIPGGKDCY